MKMPVKLTKEESKQLSWLVLHGIQNWYNGEWMVGGDSPAKLREAMSKFEAAIYVLDAICPQPHAKAATVYRCITTNKTASEFTQTSMRFKLPLASAAKTPAGCRSYLKVIDWPKTLRNVVLLTIKPKAVLTSTERLLKQLKMLSTMDGLNQELRDDARYMLNTLKAWKDQEELIINTSGLNIVKSKQLTCFDGSRPSSAAKCL